MIPEVIFFDKDGTLIDFDAFWVEVSKSAIGEVLLNFKVTDCEKPKSDIEYILSKIGVKDGKTDIDGILCKGTYGQIAEVICDYLMDSGGSADFDSVKEAVLKAYNNNMDKGRVVAACKNIREVLLNIKNKGIKICVVTTDNPEITNCCLEKLNIADLFEKVYTDDGVIKPKPDSDCIDSFCGETGIYKEKILMVGDTMTDIKFARNSGIPVICVGNESNRRKLKDLADATVSDISYALSAAEELGK